MSTPIIPRPNPKVGDSPRTPHPATAAGAGGSRLWRAAESSLSILPSSPVGPRGDPELLQTRAFKERLYSGNTFHFS